MSRALHIDDAEASVSETCRQLGIAISAIEPLLSGGTRVVCATSIGAHTLRTKLKTKLIEGRVTRSPLFLARRPW